MPLHPSLRTLVFTALIFLTGTCFAENIVFPADANLIDVKRDFGAKGDGKTDDTAALQSAFAKTGLIYFPNGTYLVSASFGPPPVPKGRSPSRRILQGQSEAGVIIKLADKTPAFGDPAKPLALFTISHAPEQAFRNGIRNMTFDVGKDNPGAIGMRFYASNQGGMHHVTLRADQSSGSIGLDLDYSSGNGPLLIKNISVIGFETGISGGGGHLCTHENIRVANQRKVGFYARNAAFVQGFVSVQTLPNVPAVQVEKAALVTLRDAQCQGKGEVAVLAESGGMLIVNLQTTGYTNAITSKGKNFVGPKVDQWTARDILSQFPNSGRALSLPVKPTPELPWDELKGWANVMSFGPEKVTVADGRSVFDITAALQKAIDSGATTVYLPYRSSAKPEDEYHIAGTVFVRGNVRRIIGLESNFRDSPGSVGNGNGPAFDAQVGKNIPGKFVIEKGTSPVVVIERFNAMYGELTIENRSPRTLVLSSMLIDGVALMPGAGDLFIEDVVTSFLDINGQNVWARQLNMESSFPAAETSPRPNVRQNGGTFWLHGLKTEQNRTKIIVKNGKLEVAAYILANRDKNALPMFEVIDSTFSVSIKEDVLRKAPFAIKVRETRGGVTKDFTHEAASKAGQGSQISLYVGGQK
jgi:Pectate lyase superfamily protein